MTREALKAEAEKAGLSLNGEETETEIQRLLDGLAASESPADLVNVRITSVGAFPMKGLAEVGSVHSIPAEQFSAAWMVAADKKSAKMIEAVVKRRAEEREAKAEAAKAEAAARKALLRSI